ncbi:MAG: glycosyltransferase family 9 protein [Planctomycetota bacterium]|jgi:ADP-heptose:LPS heptosyltransferase
MERLRSVLVVRMSALGDVLFALPAVRALVESGRAEHVAWLVEDRAAVLLEGWPGLDEVLVFPRGRPARWPGWAARLARRRDSVVVDFQSNLKSRLQLRLMRGPRKLGFGPTVARDGAQRAFHELVDPPPSARHRVAQNLSLVAALGIPVTTAPSRPPLHVPAPSAERADALVRSLGEGPVVLLHPGTSAFGEFKRWPARHFGVLGEQLASRCGARLLVTGSPDEQALVASVRDSIPHAASIAPTGSLHDLSALLARVDLVVAADSLPLHLANFHGTPVIGLYGPKDPARTGPFFDRSRVVVAGVACSPCTLRRCTDRLCMERLAPAQVCGAAVQLLEAGGR